VPAWARRLAQAAVAVALLVLLWQAADGPAAARTLAAASWPWLCAALAALSLQTVLSALRWRLTAGQLGIALGRGHALREYYLAQMVNQSLPGGMIGDAARAVRARGQAGLMASGQAVVFERLAGQIAMFATLALGFAITAAVPGGLDWPGWLALPVAAMLGLGMASPLALWAAARLPGASGRAAAGLRAALGRALITRRALPGQIVLSLGTTLCNLAAFAFCARAVGIDLSLGAVAGLVPLILLTMLIPLSISGWGLREGAAAGLLPLVGVGASDAFAASVAFGLVFAVSVLPGAAFMARMPQVREAKS
jgi:uncharacterized membrane protein YbhN (UPF0104 family)